MSLAMDSRPNSRNSEHGRRLACVDARDSTSRRAHRVEVN